MFATDSSLKLSGSSVKLRSRLLSALLANFKYNCTANSALALRQSILLSRLFILSGLFRPFFAIVLSALPFQLLISIRKTVFGKSFFLIKISLSQAVRVHAERRQYKHSL
jgi:hypothetical protein